MVEKYFVSYNYFDAYNYFYSCNYFDSATFQTTPPEFEYISAVYGPESESGKLGPNFKGKDVTKMISVDKDGKITSKPFKCCKVLGNDPKDNRTYYLV